MSVFLLQLVSCPPDLSYLFVPSLLVSLVYIACCFYQSCWIIITSWIIIVYLLICLISRMFIKNVIFSTKYIALMHNLLCKKTIKHNHLDNNLLLMHSVLRINSNPLLQFPNYKRIIAFLRWTFCTWRKNMAAKELAGVQYDLQYKSLLKRLRFGFPLFHTGWSTTFSPHQRKEKNSSVLLYILMNS